MENRMLHETHTRICIYKRWSTLNMRVNTLLYQLVFTFMFIVHCLYLPSLQSTSSPSDVWFISVQLYGGSGFPAAMMWNTHGSFCWPTALSAMHMLNRCNFKLNFIYAFRNGIQFHFNEIISHRNNAAQNISLLSMHSRVHSPKRLIQSQFSEKGSKFGPKSEYFQQK